MIQKNNAQLGLTLIELLAAVSVALIIFAILVSGFRNFASFQQFNKAVSDVEFLLNQVRLSARSAEGDASHGIKFTPTTMTTFTGDAYDAMDASNKTYTYNLVTLEMDLTDGTDEIVFKKLTGLPSATGTVIVHGVSFSASTSLEITDTGVIQY